MEEWWTIPDAHVMEYRIHTLLVWMIVASGTTHRFANINPFGYDKGAANEASARGLIVPWRAGHWTVVDKP